MIKRIVIDAAALAVATWLLPGITLADPWSVKGVCTLLGVAIVFGIANAIVRPLFKALTGCFVMLTFGLFLLVINGLMMLLTSWVCTQLNLGWHVDTFWPTAVEGAVIVAVISFLAAKLFKDRRR